MKSCSSTPKLTETGPYLYSLPAGGSKYKNVSHFKNVVIHSLKNSRKDIVGRWIILFLCYQILYTQINLTR